jgi:hypothetical protein
MSTPSPRDDYNRPMTGERALQLPPYHAVHAVRPPFRISGFIKTVR